MALDPTLLLQLFGGLNALGAAGSASNEAERLQQAGLNQNADLIAWLQGITNPAIAANNETLAGLTPARQQMLGYIASIMGVDPGTQITLPGGANPAVPEYLRQYANAEPGTWQNDFFRRAMYNNAKPSDVQDVLKDINGGENAAARLKRWRMPAAPTDYVAPSLNLGDTTLTVPTADQLPSWLQTTEIPQSLRDALNYSEQPYTASELTQLTEPVIGGIDSFVRNSASARSSDLAKRGLASVGGSSSAADIMSPGMMALYAQMKAPLTAQTIDMQRNQANRSNAQKTANLLTLLGLEQDQKTGQMNNLSSLLSLVQGTTPSVDTSSLTSAMTNRAGMYSDMANQYSNLAAANAGSLGQIGQNLAALVNYRRAQANRSGSNTTDYGDYNYMPYA